jgi:hypothetical protein
MITLRALMTNGSNNLMYEAREVLSALRLKTLNADPFLSIFLRKQFIHLKSTKQFFYNIGNNNLLHALYQKYS